MIGTASFFPPGALKLKRRLGCVELLGLCCPIGRTGSIANAAELLVVVRAGSLAIARFDSLATVCVGSLVIASTGSFLTGCFAFFEATVARFLVIAFSGLSAVVGADFCVIT